MPPKTAPEAVLFVLDVGLSVSQAAPGHSSFLKQAISCINMILQRKLFDSSKDMIGLVLFGTENTANNLAEDDQYQHISVARHLAPTDWDFIRYMKNDLHGTAVEADWLDALVVGMDYLREQAQKIQFSTQKMILFTDFGVAVVDDEMDTIVAGLKNMEIELIAIGLNLISNDEDDDSDDDSDDGRGDKARNGYLDTGKPKTAEQKSGEALLARIITEVDGMTLSFQDAIPQLMFFNKRSVRASPWNVTMDIGPDIKIPVSGFIKIKKASPKSWKKIYAISENTAIESETSYHQQDENQTIIEKEDTIEGYRYGTSLVPFSEEDKANMDFQSGPRCLSVLGFTRTDNVWRHLFVGEGVLYVLPRKDDQAAAVALSALIHALEELNMVGIARRVYNKNYSPKLGVLIPKIRTESECLVFIELPFMEDLRQYIFAPLCTEKNKPTEEQLKAVDSLISSMNLMTAEVDEDGKPTEAFKPKKLLNPHFQHLYQSMTERALDPGKPLQGVNDHIKNLMAPLKNLLAECKDSLDRLREAFHLEEVVLKRKKQTGASLFKSDDEISGQEETSASKKIKLEDISMASLTKGSVMEVGTVTPVEDFRSLLSRDEDFAQVSKQMQGVILRLIMDSFGNQLFSKTLDCFAALRQESVKRDPSVFNTWLQEFKTAILEKGKREFWEEVVKADRGLITKCECVKSCVLKEEAETFLRVSEEAAEQLAEEDMDDAEDLLDEL